MKKSLVCIICFLTVFLQANETPILENLSLDDAVKIAEKQNIEINIAEFDKRVNELGVKVAQGYRYGKLDATLMGMRSNDAGNVFGFKLQSREADFGAFGFDQFLGAFGQAMMKPDGTMGDYMTFAQNFGDPKAQQQLLQIVPNDLNYPDARNHFDTKLSYMIPLYTGNKLLSYKAIAKEMVSMSVLDKDSVIDQKLFEVKKTFYDISLLEKFVIDLGKIYTNIRQLENTTHEMRKEGYAKKSDLLEVQSKLSNVERMLNQAKANKELSYHFLSFLLDADVKSIKTLKLDAITCSATEEDVLAKNLDIKKAETGYKIQSKMVDVASSAYKPEIGAFAEYGSSDDKIFNKFRDHDRYTVGVQIKYNIFNGGVDSAKIEQEKIKQQKVGAQVLLARKGILLKFRKMKTELRSLTNQVESLQKEVDLANEILNSYEERYQEGLSSINDVIIKQSQQIQKLLELDRTRNLRNAKILELAKLVNKRNK